MTAVAALMSATRPAVAAPSGGTVVEGVAAISTSGAVTSINQSTNRAIINWLNFSIGANETVNFNQPSSAAVTLNRVIGNEASVIAGALNANGRVFIVNSAGILFTKDSQVNVGGLVASTLDISNNDFISGNYRFSGSSAASVINRGAIRASDGGYVALLGRTVANDGVITASLGSVALASGDRITLNFGGDSLLDVTIDKGTLNALVENRGAIRADGGRVILTARAADAVLSAQVNNSGVVQARTVADLRGGSGGGGTVRVGSIRLLASGGTTRVTGTLDASAPNGGRGGSIEARGNRVTVADDAIVTTRAASGEHGNVLIDSGGLTIGPDRVGGGFHNDEATTISAVSLGNLLGYNNVALQSSGGGTDGDLNVNGAIAWSAGTALALNAGNNININAPITTTGAGGLTLNYGGYAVTGGVASGANYNVGAPVTLSGAGSTLGINGRGYTLIRRMTDLAAINNGSGSYALAQDLDASGATYAGPVVASFSGALAGLGHTISNLTIASSGSGRAALIDTLGSSSATTATVRDIGLVNVDIRTTGNAGALVGLNWGVVSNAYATGRVSGGSTVGGLVSRNQLGSVVNSWADVSVSGTGSVGGLVGLNVGNRATNAATGVTTYTGVIRGSHASGVVRNSAATSTRNSFGGLVGANNGGAIFDSYASGDVTLTNANTSAGDLANVGGLVGLNTINGASAGSIANSYASGNVTSPGNFVGGLVGYNYGGSIDGSHASGNVAGGDNVGGVAGASDVNGALRGSIRNSYATGNVNGHDQVGGVTGRSQGTIGNVSYSVGTVTGNNQVGGAVGANSGAIGDTVVSGNVTGADQVGGIAGSNNGSIDRSSASGAVRGVSNVGGIVGLNYDINNSGNSSVSNSTSTGNVSGSSNVGELVGNNQSTVRDSSFSGGGSAVGTGSGAVTGVTRADRRSNVDAAARAVQAAARQATQAGNVTAAVATRSAAIPPNSSISAAGTRATTAGPSLDENVEVETPARSEVPVAQRPARRPSATTTTARRTAPAARDHGYGATIRSIDVDGRRYDLQDKGAGNKAPDHKAQ